MASPAPSPVSSPKPFVEVPVAKDATTSYKNGGGWEPKEGDFAICIERDDEAVIGDVIKIDAFDRGDNFDIRSSDDSDWYNSKKWRKASHAEIEAAKLKVPFQAGDKVIGLKEASSHYGVTIEGWVGTVQYVSLDGKTMGVTAVKGSDTETYNVRCAYFEKLEDGALVYVSYKKSGAWMPSKGDVAICIKEDSYHRVGDVVTIDSFDKDDRQDIYDGRYWLDSNDYKLKEKSKTSSESVRTRFAIGDKVVCIAEYDENDDVITNNEDEESITRGWEGTVSGFDEDDEWDLKIDGKDEYGDDTWYWCASKYFRKK